MRINPVYPTEFQTYNAAIKEAYGDFELIPHYEKLVEGTLFSKRYFHLFPRLASSQIQQLSVSTQDILVNGLVQSFAEMIVAPELHKRLYKISSNEELEVISTSFHSVLDRGYTDEQLYSPDVNFSDEFLEGYRRLLMPLTFEPIPKHLVNEIKKAFREMGAHILETPDYYDQVHPADTFVQCIQKAAEEYYLNKGQYLLVKYPIIPTGKAIPYSIWIIILALKWYEVFQDYIRTIEESQYKRESELLQLLSEKGLSPEAFLALDTEVALVLQDEADQRYKKGLERKPLTKAEDSKYTKLIPWMRGEDNLLGLWKTLDDLEYIEHEEFQYFFRGHFYITNKSSGEKRASFSQKIKWLSSLDNLLRMLESLVTNNIISVLPFGKRTDTEIAGRINNLIQIHFANNDGIDFKLDAIRKAAQRKRSPDAKIDRDFNGNVLKKIRSIQ